LNNTISENLKKIHERVAVVCEKVGRDTGTVKVITVTKTHPFNLVQEAVDAGSVDLGENRMQELEQKIPQIQGNVSWHLIGHLQTNKVKKVVGSVAFIHSVDSLHLAEEIDRVSKNRNICSKVLVQVNTSGEESKFGCSPKNTELLVEQISALDGLKICGLMTIGNFDEDQENVRPCFVLLKKLADQITSKNIPNVSMVELSMGMTNDFETAIEEGSTMIRVGTAIFGARSYPA